MSEAIFPEGIYYNLPRENAPEFVKGSIGINVDVAIQWLQANKNSSGYVNLDLKVSKNGKAYAQKNEWEPGGAPTASQTSPPAEPGDDIPW